MPSSRSRLLSVSCGTRNCSAHNAGESGLILQQGGSLTVFLELRWEPGVYSLVMMWMALLDSCLFRTSGLCLVAKDTSGFSSRFGRAITLPLELRRETQGPFAVATVILRFLSIFKVSQASSPFEAMNCALLLCCQRDVRPHIEMRRGTSLSPGSAQVIQTSLHLG